MKKIEEHIYELLFTQNCVTIPNFGGFVTQNNSANFSSEGSFLTPPSKTVNFNKHLKNDDGLLTHEVANYRAINYDSASKVIKEFVSDLSHQLKSKKRVELDKVGTLFLDNNDILSFSPSDTNFSTTHFGLPVLQPKIKATKKLPVTDTLSKEIIEKVETPIIPLEQTKNSRKTNYWWAAAILIPIIFYSAWIPMKTDLMNGGKQFHYSDLNPFTFNKTKNYESNKLENTVFETINFSRAYTDDFQKVNLDTKTYLWVDSSIELPKAAVRETTYVENKTIEVTNTSQLKYHLIGGCFGNKTNASSFVKHLNELGYEAKIIDQNQNLYRVSVGNYSKRSTAKKAKERLLEEQEIKAWILKK